MKEHSRKIVWLAAALLALSANAADARQQHGSQAQSGIQSQQQAAAGMQQRQRQQQRVQQQDQSQQRMLKRQRIHAADPAAPGQLRGQARQDQSEGDGNG